MGDQAASMEQKNGDSTVFSQFEAFIVLDFETNNLPCENYNKVSVTELCMYGCLKEHFLQTVESVQKIVIPNAPTVPQIPRATQKLTLHVNPRAPISPSSEKITGLNNYLLEKCNNFDKNTANMVLHFINQFPQPVCLVAHNGFQFDFPILKWLLAKFDVKLPQDCLCIDSYRAFYDIDGIGDISDAIKICGEIQQNDMRNWKELNETTPKRLNISPDMNRSMRKHVNNHSARYRKDAVKSKRNLFPDSDSDTDTNSDIEVASVLDTQPKEAFKNPVAVNRMLQSFYPNTPAGFYKLGNIYKRIFGTLPQVAHYAEADVYSLLVLMIHYGKEFLKYAEEWAAPFEKIEMKYKITN